MDNKKSLEEKLKVIEKVFKLEDILNIKLDNEYVQKYYKVNQIPYSIFHTNTGLIHLGISRDGVYKEEDLLEQVKVVEKYLKAGGGNKVLELATGRGANSLYLAKKFPEIEFYGVDISKGHLDYAFKEAKKAKKYYPDYCDYHNLSKFEKETFDMVFIIESLCYSTDKGKVLAEVCRVLKKQGVFVIVDLYSNNKLIRATSSGEIATKLLERGMAVKKFETYESLVDKINSNNFRIESEEDVSNLIIPTVRRFENEASHFFKHPRIARLIAKIAPKEFLYNTVSGYLFPMLMELELFDYKITVLRKD